MRLSDVLRSLARRWYLVGAVAAVTMLAGFLVFRSVPLTYSMTANVVLIPPKSTEDPNSNRYLSLGGMGPAADVLVRSVDAAATRTTIESPESPATYQVSSDATTSAPVLVVTSEAESAREAREVLDAVMAVVPQRLEALQERLQIRREFRISSLELARDSEPEVSHKPRLRAVAAVTVLLLAAGLLMVAALDGLLLRRSLRAPRGETPARKDDETVGRKPDKARRSISLASGPSADAASRNRKPPTSPPRKGGTPARNSPRTRSTG